MANETDSTDAKSKRSKAIGSGRSSKNMEKQYALGQDQGRAEVVRREEVCKCRPRASDTGHTSSSYGRTGGVAVGKIGVAAPCAVMAAETEAKTEGGQREVLALCVRLLAVIGDWQRGM
jgi:hypothetical protein